MKSSGLTAGAATLQDTARGVLRQVFAEAVAAVRGDKVVREYSWLDGDRWTVEASGQRLSWTLPRTGRIIVVGAGKAAASLARGLEEQLGDRIDAGCVIVKHGHTEPLQRIRQIEAGHPVPDHNSIAATLEVLDLLKDLRPDDRVFMLITGGASALMVAPVEGVTLADKAAVTGLLLRSNAPIDEINAIRRALSRVKGGRLLEHIAPAQCMTLLMSDVPGHDASLIGSGPTIIPASPGPDPLEILDRRGILTRVPANVRAELERQHQAGPANRPALAMPAQEIVLANSEAIVRAIDPVAARLGIAVQHVDLQMHGETHGAAQNLAGIMAAHAIIPQSRPRLFVSAGETTLTVTGSGQGGRNQEFALVGALGLAGQDRCFLLASGTDGTDGPTDAAGAFADGTTCHRVAEVGLDPAQTLANNDSYNLFRALGDLHITGPTGTNVMDLVLGLVL